MVGIEQLPHDILYLLLSNAATSSSELLRLASSARGLWETYNVHKQALLNVLLRNLAGDGYPYAIELIYHSRKSSSPTPLPPITYNPYNTPSPTPPSLSRPSSPVFFDYTTNPPPTTAELQTAISTTHVSIDRLSRFLHTLILSERKYYSAMQNLRASRGQTEYRNANPRTFHSAKEPRPLKVWITAVYKYAARGLAPYDCRMLRAVKGANGRNHFNSPTGFMVTSLGAIPINQFNINSFSSPANPAATAGAQGEDFDIPSYFEKEEHTRLLIAAVIQNEIDEFFGEHARFRISAAALLGVDSESDDSSSSSSGSSEHPSITDQILIPDTAPSSSFSHRPPSPTPTTINLNQTYISIMRHGRQSVFNTLSTPITGWKYACEVLLVERGDVLECMEGWVKGNVEEVDGEGLKWKRGLVKRRRRESIMVLNEWVGRGVLR